MKDEKKYTGLNRFITNNCGCYSQHFKKIYPRSYPFISLLCISKYPIMCFIKLCSLSHNAEDKENNLKVKLEI